jgi:alpha-glucosidase
MGYNAEKTDPLYKIIPYYLTLNAQTKAAYGLFYNSYSSGILDLGSEIDALWVCDL